MLQNFTEDKLTLIQVINGLVLSGSKQAWVKYVHVSDSFLKAYLNYHDYIK